VTTVDVDRVTAYIQLAEARHAQASEGVARALAALREAVGQPPGCEVDVDMTALPDPDARPDRPAVVAAALARRGELVQLSVLARVTCLEVDAQATSPCQRMATFASGADIHSRPVASESTNAEYRPGAVAPQMPVELVGPRPERVQRARALSARAEAVVAAAGNLIALEAEDAYLRWEEADKAARHTAEAESLSVRMARNLNQDYTTRQRIRTEDVVNAWVLASRAQSEHNEQLFRKIIALADLERVTSGGFCAGLISAVPAEPKSPDAKSGEPSLK
jgi:hypothetical protein